MGIHQVLLFLQILSGLSAIRGTPRFTRKPPDTLYVPSGSIARFEWDYHVDDKTTEFDPYSPEWVFYNSTKGQKVAIAIEDAFNGSLFKLQKDCPPRLRGRVSKESKATLVIINVTISDNGIYGCHLILTMSSPIQSNAQLIVTDPLRFTTHLSPITTVVEGTNLTIQCSALGKPVPNITWIRLTNTNGHDIMSEGLGKAVLRIINITRQEHGKYNCVAANNLSDQAIAIGTEVVVQTLLDLANVSVSKINESSALIKWLITSKEEKASLIHFQLQINTNPLRKIIINNTQQLIHGLTENTTYIVIVYARNVLGYGKGAVATFTTKSRGKFTERKEKITVEGKDSKNLVAIICVVGVVSLLLAIILFILLKKRWKRKRQRNGIRNFPHRVVPGTNQKEVSSSESLDSKKIASNQEQEGMPIYAMVDMTKKRRSGEVFYTELSELNLEETALSSAPIHVPTRYSETEYVDINHCRNTSDKGQ